MEIEINWRRFILIVLAIALVGGGAFVALPQLQNRNQADDELADLKATLVPERQKIVASDLKINFENRSSWQVEGVEECLPLLNDWLGEQYPLQSLAVIITDTVTSDMAVSTVFPDPRESWPPDASVNGKCNEKDIGYLTCVVGVKKGAPGPTLDMLVSVELAQLVADYYRPKTKKAWEEWTKNWKWENFQPLIHKEGDQWVSDCLHLIR